MIKWAFNVIGAWGNFILNDKAAIALAKERAKICVSCEFIATNSKLKFIVDTEVPELNGKYCKDCGCPLSAKCRGKIKCKLWTI